jgi:hypothetical protein
LPVESATFSRGQAGIWFDIYAELGYNGRLNRHESNEKRELECNSREQVLVDPVLDVTRYEEP